MIELLAQATDAATAGGIDWTGISLAITAIGGVLAAILQACGKAKWAKRAVAATAETTVAVDRLRVVVHGVENAATHGDFTVLAEQLKKAGLDVSSDTLAAVARAATKHVKASVKKTAIEHNVEDYLADLVEKTTRMDPDELRRRLADDDDEADEDTKDEADA